MKPFPSVEHLEVHEALMLLEKADNRVAEAAKPNNVETGHLHDNLQYRMLRFAADALRQEIAKTFNIEVRVPHG